MSSEDLHKAVIEGNLDDVQALLASSADVEARKSGIEGWTSLHLATINEKTAVIRALLAAGAKVDMIDYYGLTSLQIAAERGHLNIVSILFEADANANSRDHSRKTALHRAVEAGQVRVVNALISAGAEIDKEKDVRGWTPLLYAAKKGFEFVAESLLLRGANVHECDPFAQTALFIASVNGHVNVMAVLEAAIAEEKKQE